jgi:hypothetical protein
MESSNQPLKLTTYLDFFSLEKAVGVNRYDDMEHINANTWAFFRLMYSPEF